MMFKIFSRFVVGLFALSSMSAWSCMYDFEDFGEWCASLGKTVYVISCPEFGNNLFFGCLPPEINPALSGHYLCYTG